MNRIFHISFMVLLTLMTSSILSAQQKGTATQTVAFAVMRATFAGSLFESFGTGGSALQHPVTKMTVSFDGKNFRTQEVRTQSSPQELRGSNSRPSRRGSINLRGTTRSLITVTD